MMYMRCMDERRAAIRKCKKLLFVSYRKKKKKKEKQSLLGVF